MKILLVEDDAAIASGLAYSLQAEGWEPVVCSTVAQAKKELLTETFGLLLLDVTLPDGDGYEVFRYARAMGEVPILFLTARDEEVNIVMGLDMGADDYVTKPFRIRELISRIRSVLRRYKADDQGIYRRGNLLIDTKKGTVSAGDTDIPLTALEYRLLLAFISHPGQVLTRNKLLEDIWDVGGDFVNDNTLTVYIKRLRDKLTEATGEDFISTVWGRGYKWEEKGHEKP